eukprot:CAMPEP_0172751936 /NCGR_PEP_ID=MMETSP1074-20121228/152848_1 /TAXON_ID=2916 /ORGANISM="Ceratium fusus, Strain PA161109" /LENGTH=57 /DNA_ID=CAMNT_0013584371 /DNA_START=10 /DNA_END=180 /DNA_ORIENTATION=+
MAQGEWNMQETISTTAEKLPIQRNDAKKKAVNGVAGKHSGAGKTTQVETTEAATRKH